MAIEIKVPDIGADEVEITGSRSKWATKLKPNSR